VEECYKKLYALVVDAGKRSVKGETSKAKVERVKGLYVAWLVALASFAADMVFA